MDLVTTQGTFVVSVHATPPQANGTLVYVLSNGTIGWNLGEFRADGLEQLLQTAAAAAAPPPLPATTPATPH
jgi:hypothetical protein